MIAFLVFSTVMDFAFDCNISSVSLGRNDCSTTVDEFFQVLAEIGLLGVLPGMILIPPAFILVKLIQYFKFTPEEKTQNRSKNGKFYKLYAVILIGAVVYFVVTDLIVPGLLWDVIMQWLNIFNPRTTYFDAATLLFG